MIDNATRRIVSAQPYRLTAAETTGDVWTMVLAGPLDDRGGCDLRDRDQLGNRGSTRQVSSVGGVIGAAVSGSTLFLFAVVNSVLLYQSIAVSRRHRKASFRNTQQASTPNTSPSDEENMPTKAMDADEEPMNDSKAVDHRFRGIFHAHRLSTVPTGDRPYKLYPVGVLFGLGFDTASSIALWALRARRIRRCRIPIWDRGTTFFLPMRRDDRMLRSCCLRCCLRRA